MPQFPQQQPPVGQEVTITLTNGETLTAEYDGLQWWANLPESEGRAPIVNQFVEAWSL